MAARRVAESIVRGEAENPLVDWRYGALDPDLLPGVDLLLGPALAELVLRTADETKVGIVWAEDSSVLRLAEELGFETATGEILEPGAPVALSIHYPRILSPDELARYEAAYNIHPGFLPWGRGFYPYHWAIVAGEPAGATLHRMTEEISRDMQMCLAPRIVELVQDELRRRGAIRQQDITI